MPYPGTPINDISIINSKSKTKYEFFKTLYIKGNIYMQKDNIANR